MIRELILHNTFVQQQQPQQQQGQEKNKTKKKLMSNATIFAVFEVSTHNRNQLFFFCSPLSPSAIIFELYVDFFEAAHWTWTMKNFCFSLAFLPIFLFPFYYSSFTEISLFLDDEIDDDHQQKIRGEARRKAEYNGNKQNVLWNQRKMTKYAIEKNWKGKSFCFFRRRHHKLFSFLFFFFLLSLAWLGLSLACLVFSFFAWSLKCFSQFFLLFCTSISILGPNNNRYWLS